MSSLRWHTCLINFTKYWDYVDNNHIKLDFKKNFKKFEKSNLYKILKMHFPDIKDKDRLFNMCEFLYPYQFQNLILGKQYIDGLEPVFYIDVIDLIYMYKINFDTDLILAYFYNKLLFIQLTKLNNKKISLDIPYHEDHKRPEPHRDFFGR